MQKLKYTFYYIIFSINLGIFLAYILLWIGAAKNRLFLQADLTAHYTGWAMIRDGYKSQLYDLNLQQQYQQQILKDRFFSDGPLIYNYSPHTALLFSFLSNFSLLGAFYIWSLIQVVCLLVFLISISNILITSSRKERTLIYLAILAFPPLFFNFMIGALSLWMSLSAIKMYENLKNNHQIKAGIWWLLTTNKPQFMIFPVLLLFMSKRWKAVATIVLSSILIFILISSEFGWGIWSDYLRILIRSNTQFGTYGTDPKAMYNLKAILTLTLGEQNANMINLFSWIIFITASLGIIYLWWGVKWESQSPLVELKYSLTLTMFIFTFPHVNAHDSLLLVPAAIIFYKYLLDNKFSTKLFSIFMLSWPSIFLISKFAEKIKISPWIPPVMIAIFLAWQIRFWINEKLSNPGSKLAAQV